MDYIEKSVGNARFVFLVDSYSNRSGFVHRCSLRLNGEEIAAAKAQYYNRTWEAYRFQSVMLSCVYSALEQAETEIVNSEKEKRGWSRLTQARRNEIAKIVAEQDGVKVLRRLELIVKNAWYGTEEERERLETLDCMLAVWEALRGKAA